MTSFVKGNHISRKFQDGKMLIYARGKKNISEKREETSSYLRHCFKIFKRGPFTLLDSLLEK